MTRRHFVLSFAFMALTGCSGNGLIHKNNQTLTIESTPAGASVHVMEENVGLTPMQLRLERIFPLVYDNHQQPLYGKVLLKKRGCRDYLVTVSSHLISEGLRARLDCDRNSHPDLEQLRQAEPPTPDKSPKQRLRQLEELRKAGLITEKEYRDLRHKIMDSL